MLSVFGPLADCLVMSTLGAKADSENAGEQVVIVRGSTPKKAVSEVNLIGRKSEEAAKAPILYLVPFPYSGNMKSNKPCWWLLGFFHFVIFMPLMITVTHL